MPGASQNQIPHSTAQIPCNNGTFRLQDEKDIFWCVVGSFVVSLPFGNDQIGLVKMAQKRLVAFGEDCSGGVRSVVDHSLLKGIARLNPIIFSSGSS